MNNTLNKYEQAFKNLLVPNINLFETRTFTSEINKGQQLVNTGSLKKLIATTNNNKVTLTGYFIDNNEFIKTELTYTHETRFSYEIIDSCQCSDCNNYSKYYLCAHMYAMIYFLSINHVEGPQYTYVVPGFENIESDYINKRYDKNVLTLLNSMEKIESAPLLIDQHWSLYPEISKDGEIKFKLLLPRKYLIKNLSTFVVDVTNGYVQTFGKNVYKLTKDSLDEDSEVYFDFISSCLLEAFNNHANGKYTSHIFIEHHIDLVYKIFSELRKDIDYDSNGSQLYFDETTLDIYLSENSDGLSVNVSLDLLYLKPNVTYYASQSCLLIKIDNETEIEYHFFKVNEYSLAFIKELLKKGGTLDISKTMCDNFISLTSQYAGKTIRFHYNDKVIENKYIIDFYFDINDDNLLTLDQTITIDDNKYYNQYNIDYKSAALNNIHALLDPLNVGFDKKTGSFLMDPSNDKVIELIRYGIVTLQRYANVYVTDRVRNMTRKVSYNFSLGIRFNNGLLDVSLSSDQLDPQEIAKILDSYRKKRKFYKLKNGNVINLENREIAHANTLLEDFNVDLNDVDNGHFNVAQYRIANINERLKETHFRINRDQTFNAELQRFQNAGKVDYPLDAKYAKIFREYQVNGFKWLMFMLDCGFNPILADDMGLGKTVQVLSVIEAIKKQGPTLVICPATLVYNWKSECDKFNADLKSICVVTNKQYRESIYAKYNEYDLLITSYDYAKRDEAILTSLNFNLVILDEAQYIKNTKTKNAQTVKAIPSLHRLALTGTPIENTLAELWSIFDFLMPGYLYNYPYFKRAYESPIVEYDDEKAKVKLQSMVKPFILRRVKKDVLKELPEKIEKVETIYFNEQEREIYNANLALANKKIRAMDLDDSKSKFVMFALLLKLRQICCDPSLVYEDFNTYSSKCEAAFEIIENVKLQKGKVLLFSSFTSMLDILAKKADELNISYYMLTGSDSKEKRAKMVEDFQSDDTTLFLISLKAGGTGLNLTAANTVIHYDPWWNQSATNQATDRAYRIGQNNNVLVYKLVMQDSIEEKIVKMQQQKQALSDDFIQTNDTSLQSLSKQEIIDLFKD